MAKVEILLSQAKAAAPDFDAAVADYIQAMTAHGLGPEGVPAPVAPPLVEAAVLRVQHPTEGVHQPERTYWKEIDGETVLVTEPEGEPIHFVSSEKPDEFIPNYVIIDDTPPPPTLDEQKAKLAGDAAAVADAAVNRFSPPLKRRLFNANVARAHSVDEAERLPADKAILAQAEDFAVRTEAIYFHLAQVEAQIHDLTDETIVGWELPEFPA